MSREYRLGVLLCALFNQDEFRLFLGQEATTSAALQHVSVGGSPAAWFQEVVGALERRGLIELRFWKSLEQERPGRREEIRKVRALWESNTENSPNDTLLTDTARRQAIDILAQTFRRAFALNFTTRFARPKEFESVSRSLAECHSAIQSRYVHFAAEAPSPHTAALHRVLSSLNCLTRMFEAMEPHLRGRFDVAGPLAEKFKAAEAQRLIYVADLVRFAELVGVPLPEIPASEDPFITRPCAR